MNLSRCSNLIVLSILFCFGCNPPTASTGIPNSNKVSNHAQALQDDSRMMAHPEYANWSQFPALAEVIRKRIVSNENGKVIVTTRMWLESKSDSEVNVGSQVTVERPGESIEKNPSNVVSYPASFRLPKGMTEDQFSKPSNKAKEVGKEAITVGDQVFDSTIYEWEENNEAGPMTVKLWRCDLMPGRIVRQKLFTVSSKTETSEEVISVK